MFSPSWIKKLKSFFHLFLRHILYNFLSCSEQHIDEKAEKAEKCRLVEDDRPALGRFQYVAGEFDADKARQCANRVHHAEHGAGILGRQILRIDHDASVVEAAASDRARHQKQRHGKCSRLRDQHEEKSATAQ